MIVLYYEPRSCLQCETLVVLLVALDAWFERVRRYSSDFGNRVN